MGADTRPDVVEVVDENAAALVDALGPLAGLLPPGMIDALGGLLPDADAVTLDQIDESVSELHDKIDRVLAVLDALVSDVRAVASVLDGPLNRAGIKLATRNL